MRNTIVINAIDLSPYAMKALPGGMSAFQRVCKAVSSPQDSLVVLSRQPMPVDNARNCVRSEWNPEILLETLIEESEGSDHLLYVYGDCPFLDPALMGKMFEQHIRYFAGYTFADGYPYGLAPEILQTRVLTLLKTLAEGETGAIQRDTLFEVLKKDINSFDIETEISPRDLRYLRLSLTCDTMLNDRIVRRLISASLDTTEALVEKLAESESLLRTVPATLVLQVCDDAFQKPDYLPEVKRSGRQITANEYEEILGQLSVLNPEAHILFSLFGSEPSMHPEIIPFLRLAVEKGFTAVVETSGLGWKDHDVESLANLPAGKLSWIITADAVSEDLYHRIRGDGFHEMHTFIERLAPLFPREVYIQAVRTLDNEEEMESFYRSWKEHDLKPIIQKYNSYSERLPQKKVTDLSPLRRTVCWHLKRDMVVLSDGTALLCGEDYQKNWVLGNIFEEGLEEVWEKGHSSYLKHLTGEYESLCRKCDEYYTYLF